MSFFDRQGIPGWVLKPPRVTKEEIPGRCLDEAGDTDFDDGSIATDGATDGDIDGATDDGLTDDSADITDDGFEDDVAMLRDYCLIATYGMVDEFEMHSLVQLSTRRWLEVSGQQEMFHRQYIERMAAAFPTGEYENWTMCQSLFAHVQVVLGYRPSENRDEIWATLLHNGGWFAWSQGRYEVAQQMLGEARKIREKTLGKKDMATLASTSTFALVLRDRGRWEEAEKLFVQVMETSKTKLGADHPDTLTSMANLASTFWNQGRWEEAEKLFVQVMETRKTKLGADHPDTLTSMNNLAFTWKSQGRHSDAFALMKDCVQAQQRLLGAEHPDTLSSLATVAGWSS
ncbi:Tetratricopeptide repeat-domain-containing protein [Triangularia setosa]|uniref:Tetratricopeptide repeat-domain-containing protein n=1 Tax=Triangularia setosa TaxID=2587417 RepID=A0AAN7AAV3_9PEZI|nr:Tetratricopeptide repeat-domain-containing protein [Podospora setosa]